MMAQMLAVLGGEGGVPRGGDEALGEWGGGERYREVERG